MCLRAVSTNGRMITVNVSIRAELPAYGHLRNVTSDAEEGSFSGR